MHSIYLEVKETASKAERNRLLLENLASIMQKIETKKKVYSLERQVKDHEYPKNLLCQDFQNRMHMQDLKKLEKIRDQLRDNDEVD